MGPLIVDKHGNLVPAGLSGKRSEEYRREAAEADQIAMLKNLLGPVLNKVTMDQLQTLTVPEFAPFTRFYVSGADWGDIGLKEMRSIKASLTKLGLM